jgi:hypothetical protein
MARRAEGGSPAAEADAASSLDAAGAGGVGQTESPRAIASRCAPRVRHSLQVYTLLDRGCDWGVGKGSSDFYRRLVALAVLVLDAATSGSDG